jgi:hypothetical protein
VPSQGPDFVPRGICPAPLPGGHDDRFRPESCHCPDSTRLDGNARGVALARHWVLGREFVAIATAGRRQDSVRRTFF